jgi:hypothetical protein
LILKERVKRNKIISLNVRPLKNAKFCFSSRKAKILTTGIHPVFRGLKFEPDAEIGQKGVFFKGLNVSNKILKGCTYGNKKY